MNRNKNFQDNKPLLYLIATPIGNLKEISERALETIKEMDIIAAEDTRNTFSLLSHYGIKKDLFSLREHNEIEASNHLISLLKQGKKIAYVSDAGYPGISDPGYLLVRTALENDINVSTISGSSAFINALVASGLPTDHFYFYGFLSKKGNEARRALENLKNREETLIFYESPHQIKETIDLLYETLGNREVTLARELTKINEEYIRGSLEELTKVDPSSIKGEIVIIVSGASQKELEISDEKIIERINYYLDKGVSKKAVIEIIVDEVHVRKNNVYKLVEEIKKMD